MDLMNFVPSSDNVEVELKIKNKNLTNADGSNMTITVLSPYSKEYRKVLQNITEEELKKKEDKDYVLESVEDFSINLLAKSTVKWDITWDGKKVDYSEELAKEIYTKAFWIRLLIQDAQASLADFTIP